MKKGAEFTKEHKEKLAAAWTLERRQRMSEQRRGAAHPLFGKKRDPKLVEALRERMTGERNPNFGKKISEERRNTLSEMNTDKSARLQKYGISDEIYKAERAAGKRWCFFRRHFAPESEFVGDRGCCSSCRSDHERKSDLKRNYGVTQEWYEAKVAEQGGGCATCGKVAASRGDKYLAVDHDHTTGATRGVLCHRCNTAIERVEMVPNWAMRVLAYLEKYKA